MWHTVPFGPIIDPKLLMAGAVRKVTGQARAKVRALLRTHVMYDIKTMMQQYKTHVLPILEGITSAVYHSSMTNLGQVQAVQDTFLRALGLSDAVAFTHFALGPLQLRPKTPKPQNPELMNFYINKFRTII